MSSIAAEELAEATDGRRPVKGGTVSWACYPGFPPSTIFPFTPPERIGTRNLFEFQMLMYRPLYWLGKDGQPGVDYDLSLAEPPQWSDDGRSVTVTIKPWKWSNGETICADNVMFWVNMMVVKGARYGSYSPGYFPDNLTSYEKIAADKVRFTFDKAYSKTWVLMNQLTLITPMPKAWDRTADGPANASSDPADIPAVYDYLVTENGEWTEESNEVRTRWATSPVWSVVSGPWRLKSYTLDGVVTFVPNEQYSGPNKPHIDEFRQVPSKSDEAEYSQLQAGPHGPDSIQVGYLPYGMEAEPIADPAADRSNPLAEHYRLVPQNVYCIRYLPFNFDNPVAAGRVFKQLYFRQALQSTLDQDSAIRDIYHGYGYRTDGPVPAVPDNEHVSPTQRGNPLSFDIARARKLLEDNGWDVSVTPAVCVRPGTGPGCAGEGIKTGDRLSFRLRYMEGRIALRRLMAQFEEDAARAGIELRLEEVYGSVLVGQDHSEAVQRWELNCWNGGWAFYGHFTGEMLFKTGAASNYSNFSDPKADELIDKTVVSDDVNALYEYQDYVAEHLPVIWIPGFPMRLFEIAKNLNGVEPINPYGVINPENWYYVED